MAVKKCCVENCKSSSTRTEDVGVTYHKFPKDKALRETWVSVTQFTHSDTDHSTYVCSRHFCKSDFKIYQDSKYVLKSDAIPSIFSWKMTDVTKDTKVNNEVSDKEENEKLNQSNTSNEFEGENLEAIKKFIEDQEKEIQETKEKAKNEVEQSDILEKMQVIEQGDPMVIATSVMDMILSESEAKIANKNIKPIPKQSLSPKDKGNSMALSVGSKVEVKDFSEFWYPAEIIEVDYDEMEVLVHYNSVANKHDEWICVSSPRLRPMTANTLTPSTSAMQEPRETSKEENQEEKTKFNYVVGERCLARWRDNRRFVATISNNLGNGHYEVIFDDGFVWRCSTSRLYKLKSSRKNEFLTVDTSMSPTASTTSPILSGGPSASTNQLYPILHNHLFDPTRDYLGTKSERREKKRKLNIKEIFNIGQKKRKVKLPKEKVNKIPKEKKVKVVGKNPKPEAQVREDKAEAKAEIPDAVASIIGMVTKDDKGSITKETVEKTAIETGVDKVKTPVDDKTDSKEVEIKHETDMEIKNDLGDISSVVSNSELVTPSDLGLDSPPPYMEPVIEEEMKLENFEKPDDSKQEVIEKMKEVINKLEDNLNQLDAKVDSPKSSPKIEITELKPVSEVQDTNKEKTKKVSKLKKNKKLRLLQEKKVKKQVEIVKNELEEMKKQVEEMRKEMRLKTEELSSARPSEMPESFLLPGEWCCKWVNGQPVGNVSEIEAEAKVDGGKLPLLRRSVQVEDKRLPPGWTKHMVRRSLGQSAGKWDVVLIAPDNRRFHTKTDMRTFLEINRDENLKPFEYALLDFGVHLKLSRRMGWVSNTADGMLPPSGVKVLSPLIKRKKIGHKIKEEKKERKRKKQKPSLSNEPGTSSVAASDTPDLTDVSLEAPALEDGYVYVGSLKVQIIENLLRCPADGCFKNFRNNTLLQMHIKHYHRELKKMLGTTPKVLDLARKRTKPSVGLKPQKSRHGAQSKIIKVKVRPPKRSEEPKLDIKPKLQEPISEINIDIPPVLSKMESSIPRSQDSPKLRQALGNKPVKRPKVLLPVRRPDPELIVEKNEVPSLEYDESTIETVFETPVESVDFEAEISTHTVSRPLDDVKKKIEKKRKYFSMISKKPLSEDDEWYANSDVETRSSYPGSATPDSKTMDKGLSNQHMVLSSESNNEDQRDNNMYIYTETGERIKIEHMKREEIINCHCGYREEDGLMVQCELCLCWQHALCHNIRNETEVPEKYTCSICLNPRRGRRSKRFLHDQDRLYEGLLPGAKPCESLRRSHELSGNLLRIQDALHALRVKYYVATKKDHPKLYLWAKDWENSEATFTQERLNADYSDLNIIINNIGKENLPVKTEDVKDVNLDMRTPIIDETEHDRFTQNPSSLLNLTTALSSPSGGPSLDLPITTSELERLAKSVQEQEVQRNVIVPQPEAAIENSVCRERLLKHVQRCQALIDARLDSIDAQVAELESQDPSFEDDETADYFPRTKQTIQMLMRDLDTMEELGVIT